MRTIWTRAFREIVLIPSPERNYSRLAPSHPDHRTVGSVGSAALDAVFREGVRGPGGEL